MSNATATQEKRFIRLIPSNNSSTGFSPSGSQPIIRFSVSDTKALALMKDARLNFKVRITKTGGADIAFTDDVNIDPVMGFCSVMEQVIVSSRRHGTQLEQIVNLGRLESSFYRSNYSPKMLSTCQYNSSKSVGLGRMNRWDGDFSSSSTTTDLKSLAMRKSIIGQKEVSIPFHAGIFMTDAPLDLSAVGGLELAVYLTRNEAMFFGGFGGMADVSYTITDVSLTIPLLYKTMEQIQQTPPESVVEFLNWTSLYSVLDSSVSSISHRLNLTGLVSAIHNVLPTAQINNTAYNQFGLKSPAPERLTFQRDGVRSPLEKTMVVEDKRTSKSGDKSTTYPEILTEYQSAWGSPKMTKASLVIPELVKGVANRSGVFGLGCNYSPDSAGINMSGTLSMDLQSRLENETGGDPTTIEPYAMYSYYLSRQAFATSPQGIKSL